MAVHMPRQLLLMHKAWITVVLLVFIAVTCSAGGAPTSSECAGLESNCAEGPKVGAPNTNSDVNIEAQAQNAAATQYKYKQTGNGNSTIITILGVVSAAFIAALLIRHFYLYFSGRLGYSRWDATPNVLLYITPHQSQQSQRHPI